MAHSQGTAYVAPERYGSTSSASSNNSPFVRAAGWEAYQAGPSINDGQPSFAASSSSTLPGALGIQSTGGLRTHAPQSADELGARSSSAGPSSAAWSRQPPSRLPDVQANSNSPLYGRRPSTGDGEAGAAASALANREANNSSRNGTRRPGTAGELSGDALGASNASNMRNFLVPISGTGARQKLSILSASQRPRTAQAAPVANFAPAATKGGSQFNKHDDQATIGGSTTASATRSEADRRITVQRSDSDLSRQRALAAASMAEASRQPLPNDFRSNLSRQGQNGTLDKQENLRPLTDRSYPPSTTSTRPARSFSESGAGFSPQLTSVLTGQATETPVTVPLIEGPAAQNHSSDFYHQKSSSQVSLKSLSRRLDRSAKNTASEASLPRSVSQPHPAPPTTVDQGKRSMSGRTDRRKESFDNANPPRPSSATPSSREKTSTLKGLQKFFVRGNKGSQRPSTAHSISTSSISPPQPQRLGSATVSSLALSHSSSMGSAGSKHSLEQAGRLGQGPVLDLEDPLVAHQQHRSPSSMSNRSAADSIGYSASYLPRQASSELSATGRDRQNSSLGSNPSWGSFSAQSMRSQESFTDTYTDAAESAAGSVRTAGRRPSKELAGNGAPYGAPQNEDRSKTPLPQSSANYGRVRRSSNESDWSQRTTTKNDAFASKKPDDEPDRDNLLVKSASGSSLNSTTAPASHQARLGNLLSGSADGQIYSAPNSSRSLSPTDPNKPIAPITSPLLASILGQQMTSGSSSPSSEQSTESKSKQVTEASPNIAALATTAPEVSAKPVVPAKSRRRVPSSIDSLSDASLPPLSSSLTNESSPSPLSRSGFTRDEQGDKSKTSSNVKDAEPNPKTYVPADALKRTRKGVPVRSNVKEDSASTPAAIPLITPVPDAVGQEGVVPSAEDREGSDGQVISFGSSDYENDEVGLDSIDTVNLLPSSAWDEVDAALQRFKAIPAQSANDKGTLLRTILLPFLALEAETPDTQVSGAGAFQISKSRRELFFEWIRQLLFELQTIQTSADRGAILESIACIIESRNLSPQVIGKDKDDEQSFFGALGHILSYAIGELNKKGVYQNTLIFSGRLLAVAFFRIEGVASKLLRALPVNRFALERVANEADWQAAQPSDWRSFKQQFPHWLHNFCFEDARSYLKMLDSQSGRAEDDDRFLVRQDSVEVEMSGNWLRRWQSDDSELFFSFCRNYHRQLASILFVQKSSNTQQHFFGGPGYAHLATCIHQKCLSLVHREILSVTTLSSQKNFNPGETANVLSGSTAGKPRHLEAANRRCTAIVVDIVRTVSGPQTQSSIFAAMLGIHIKCLVKRTSLYDVQGVFCLLDWLDGVLVHMESAEMVVEEFVDVDFLLETIWLLLKDADHALALMRTIAFCYSNFAILTGTRRHRERFFEEILLSPSIFQKLFLSWSFTIRAYFLHLLVFRLARINDFSSPDDDPLGKTSLRVVRLFSKRLDEIRKRHDELSPQLSSADSQSDEEEVSGKRRPQSFVSTIRHTPSVHKMELSPSVTKAERVLGIGMPDPVLANKGENKAQSRAAKWLRALGGKGGGKGKSGSNTVNSNGMATRPSGLSLDGPSSDASGLSPLEEAPRIHNEPRARLTPLDEMDMFADDDDEAQNEAEGRQGSEDEDLTPRSEAEFDLNLDSRSEPSSASETSTSAAAAPAQLDGDKLTANDGTAAQAISGEHISPELSFDLQNTLSNFSPESGGAQQQRISRAFSRRRSLLPGPAFSLVHGEDESDSDGGRDGEEERSQSVHDEAENEVRSIKATETTHVDKDASPPYHRNLHIYAVQSLREYEQTVQEHDDFFTSQQDSTVPQVPRLPIQWPAMWSE